MVLSRFLSTIIFSLFHVVILCLIFANVSVASEEREQIQYITDKDTSVTGILIPDPSPGVVPASTNEYLTFEVDDYSNNISLSPADQGRARASTELSSLTEDRHSARLTTLNPERDVKDSKQLLFIYDITPPALNLIYPESTEISGKNISFILEFSDEGSGIPSQRDKIDVVATINGSEADVSLAERDDKRFFVISYNNNGKGPFHLHLSLKDRAGNESVVNQLFTVEQNMITQQSGYFFCENSSHSFPVVLHEESNFPIISSKHFITIKPDLSDVILPLDVRILLDLEPEILKKITVISNHPALKATRTFIDNRSIHFKITQTNVVNPLESLTYLTVRYPDTISIDHEWQCINNGRDIEDMPSVETSSEMASFRIPVSLYWTYESTSQQDVINQDGDYFVQYQTWSIPERKLIDLAASFFTFENSRYFFSETDARFGAQAPVYKEGFYRYDVTLASESGVWLKNGEEIATEEHEILVSMEAPRILDFYYNKKDQQIEAAISDVGTPFENLRIKLFVEGAGSLGFDLTDSGDGKLYLVAPFPEPLGIIAATLTVSDLANNEASSNCTIFGKPPQQTDPDDSEKINYHVKPDIKETPLKSKNPVYNNKSVTELGFRGGGLADIRVCKRGQFYSKNFYDGWGGKIRNYYPSYSDRESGTGISSLLYSTMNRSISPPYSRFMREGNVSHTYSFDLCEDRVADIYPPEVKQITFDPESGQITATISDHGRLVSAIKTDITARISAPSNSWDIEKEFTSTFTAEPTPTYKTLSEKTTYKGYKLNTGSRGNNSSSHINLRSFWNSLIIEERNSMRKGVRLGYGRYVLPHQRKEVLVVLEAYLKYLQDISSATSPSLSSLQEDEHGLSGTFQAQVTIPPMKVGEVFDLTISATDSSGNTGKGTLSVSIPREPPLVYLDLVSKDSSAVFSSVNNTRTSSLFVATAVDESGLDLSLSRTFFTLDDHQLSPMSTHGTGGVRYYQGDPDDFVITDFGRNRSGNESWIEQYTGYYGALLEEGSHTALFHATDILGLSSEEQLDFEIAYPPYIFDFQSKPKAVQAAGGPAFTAMIIDSGNDIELSGIDFFINNNMISKERLYYDPVSGYFSVSGPLDLAGGYHVAEIVATDNAGHQVDKTLRFVISDDLVPIGNDSDINLSAVNIWELADHNNDGLANPGELIRIFPTLNNLSYIPLENCSGALSAGDNRILVETTEFDIEPLAPRGTTTILRGLDVRIGDDILDSTLSDPLETHFLLNVSCGDDQWDLPFTLPIYKPSNSFDVGSTVTIATESTPRSTRVGSFTLRGMATSSASYLQDMNVRVNGEEVTLTYFDKKSGKFEVVIPLRHGSNTIEIEAYDASGAVGFKTAFVNCYSELEVRIHNLPRSRKEPDITVAGTVTSSASIVKKVKMTINGIAAPIRWDQRTGSFIAYVTLNSADNLIVVEGWDEAGAYGRAHARIKMDSEITVVLDSLPPVTNDATVQVQGTVETMTIVDHVSFRVNGAEQPAHFNPSTRRFSATVNIAVGGNTIIAYAYGKNGERGYDQTFITRTTPFMPPAITIASPPDGAFLLCSPKTIQGTFSVGNSTLDALDVRVNGDGGSCNTVITGPGTFSSECDISNNIGFDEIRATVHTNDGTSATDIITVETGDCS